MAIDKCLICVAIVMMIVPGAIWGIDAIIQMRRKGAFEKQYHVPVLYTIRLKHSKTYRDVGSFVMRYPTWSAAKKDGTRDRRTNNMHINYNKSVILIGEWELFGKDPFDAYVIVVQLRNEGVPISYCKEERMKRQSVLAKEDASVYMDNIDSIIRRFKEKPTDFERFCANVFRCLGWQVQVTPSIHDGGFDLRMCDLQGRTYIAECKCYARNHHVGRPIIQKLRGVNAVERAQCAMLITTSSFSNDAIEYARRVGIRLVDGTRLMSLCRRTYQMRTRSQISESAFTLTRADIMAHIPMDMREKYYYSRSR